MGEKFMNKILIAIVLLFVILPLNLLADPDSELRAEILGEQAGKAIAGDHSEYNPDDAKVQCRDAFYKT